MPTAGSFTVGGGGTYPTWALAFAAIASLTGPITYTQIGPTLETASAALPGGFLFNGHQMLMTATNIHQGQRQNRALVIDTNHFGHIFDFSGAADDPKITVENLHVSALTGSGGAAFYFDTTGWAFNEKLFRYIMIDDGFVFGRLTYGFWFDDGGVIRPASGAYIHHCIIKDITLDGIRMPLSFSIFGTIGHLENINTSSCQRYGFNLERSTNFGVVSNCFSYSNNNLDFANLANVTGRNNASEDGSAANGNWGGGSGNLINRVVASEIYTSRKFFIGYPILSGSLVGAGTITRISATTRDLAGQQFPRVKVSPIGPDTPIRTIGAHQYSVLATEELETDDTIAVTSKMHVLGSDVFGLPDQPDVIKGFGSSGSDRLSFSEEANVRGDYITTGEDVLSVADAGVCPTRFQCVPETLTLRGRTNFWYPTDTMVNQFTLPQPRADDTYRLDTQIRIRHAKGGDLRFFKRNAVLHTLLMNFRIDHNVRDIALAFLELSSSQLVRLLDWEGRLWHGVVINTPITFLSQGKSNATEKLDFTLEFEGIRIN